MRALPGDVDATYAGDGKVAVSIGFADDHAWDAAIQPNGKVVVAGDAYAGGSETNVALARLTRAGALDPSFSGDGRFTIDVGAAAAPGFVQDEAGAVAVHTDGSIVAASAGYVFDGTEDTLLLVILRLEADGTLDPTFGGGDGIVVTDVGSIDAVGDLAIQSDGRLVVAGSTYSYSLPYADVALLRFEVDGDLDSTFGGGDGISTLDADDSFDSAYGIAIQDDGKLVVAGGSSQYGAYGDSAVFRFEDDGDPDATFGGGDGVIVESLAGANLDFAGAVAVVGGKMFVAANDGQQLVVLKLDAGGDRDAAFGDDGVATATFAIGTGNPRAVIVQPDGAILIVGSTPYLFDGDFAVARFDADGVVDATFGDGDGNVEIDLGSDRDVASAAVRQEDGKIVVVGTSHLHLSGDSYTNAYDAFVLARIKTSVPLHQPDGLIKRSSASTFVGDDIYESTAKSQVVESRTSRRSTASFTIRITNDGSSKDSFMVDGCGSSGGFRVRYAKGSDSITRAVVNGTYKIAGVLPNRGVSISLKITVGRDVLPGMRRSCPVLSVSVHDPAARDAVKAKVTAKS